ncbi:EamA family transporter [Desulfobacterota bacterium AH_259_B03_O07]|nr:EamA family transporter [Desulfobacterota bacterium AH_259_B03_O07]
MKAAALALLVASIWGISPIFEKLSLIKASPFTVITIRFIFTTICLVIISLVTGKYKDFANVDGKTFLWIILAGFLGGIVGLFLFFVALKQDFTSRIVPIAATFPLFTVLYAFIFFREEISTNRLAGAIFIVLGLVLINWDSIVSHPE